MTIEALLKESELDLLDAELLLAYVLGVGREYLMAHGDQEVENDLLDLFRMYQERRAGGEPLAYIVKGKEFFGLDFYVDERVLVPRPETEMIVEHALSYLGQAGGRGFKVLDVGTGSGCIPIAVAVSDREADDLIGEIVASDLSSGAIQVAAINRELHGLENKIQLVEGDLLEFVEENERFDLITANLPYIGEEDNRNLEADVEKFEPAAALWGGADGLELYRKMFDQIRDKQIDFGVILGEFGFGQGKGVEDILNNYFDQNWEIKKDVAGIDRMFIIRGNE